MSFLRGFSIAMGANIIVFVLSFLNNKLLFVYMSTEDNGSYFLIMRYALFFTLLFGEWLRLTNINIAGQAHELTRKLITNVLTYVSVIALLIVLLFMFKPSILSHIPGVTPFLAGFSCVVGLLFIIRDSSQSLLLVNDRMVTYGFTNIIWGVLMLVQICVVVILLQKGLESVAFILVISTAIAAIWAFVNCIKLYGMSAKPSLRIFKRASQLGVRSIIAVAGTYLMINIHGFILEPLIPDPALGLYMVGLFSVIFRIYLLFQRVSDVTSTIVFSQVAQRTATASANLTAKVHRYILIVFSSGVLLAALLGKYIIYIIASNKYSEALIPLYLILPGIICFNMGLVINSFYWGRGYPLRVILPPYAFCFLGIVLNVLLVPNFGISGAAISFSMAAIPWYLYLIIVFHNDYNIPYSTLLIPKFSDIAIYWNRVRAKFVTL